jgi:hypothetical protein
MASVDSAKFSAIFTQVESLHELGMDEQLFRARTRDFQILLAEFSVVWTRRSVWLIARSMPVLAVWASLSYRIEFYFVLLC